MGGYKPLCMKTTKASEKRKRVWPKIVTSEAVYKRCLALRKELKHKSWSSMFKELSLEVLDANNGDVMINAATGMNYLAIWIKNISANFEVLMKPEIKDVVALRDKLKGRRAVVVGGGPSVEKNRHLKVLSDYINADPKPSDPLDELAIITTDRMLIPCLKAGLLPSLVVSVDGSDKIVKFFDDPEVRNLASEMMFAPCVMTNPEILNALYQNRGQLYVGIPFLPSDSLPNVQEVVYKLLRERFSVMANGGNCGTYAWLLANLAGCSEVALIGFDMGYPRDTRIWDTQYMPHFDKHFEGDMKKIEKCYMKVRHPCWGKGFYAFTDAVFEGYARNTLEFVRNCTSGMKTYNCTEGGALCAEIYKPTKGKGVMKCITLKEFLERKPAAAKPVS